MIEKIRSLQDQDCAIRDIKKELSDIPAREKEEESRMDEHKTQLAEADGALKNRHAAVKELEIEIESRHQKINKLRQQQLEIKTNQEFKAIENEVHAISEGISELEDQQLILMEEMELAKADVAEKKRSLAEEAVAVQSDKEVLSKRAAELKLELQKMEKEREVAAKEIDSTWLDRYDRIFSRKDKAVVALENGICSGCHMKLPPAVIHSAGRQGEMVFCDYCGRLLY